MVNPDMTRAKNGNAVAVRHCSPSIMGRGATNHGITSSFTVMNMETVNNNIGHKLDGNACTVCYVYVSATSIDCFKTVHNKLLF